MSLEKKLNLHAAEEVLQVVRRHGATYFWHYFFGFSIMTTKSFLMFWLFHQGWWGYAVFAGGMALGIAIIVRAMFHRRNNVAVITSERVVDISRPSFFSEIVSPVGYLDVQDVFVEKKGIFASLFNYGNVLVRTKNDQTFLCIERVSDPHRLADVILTARDKHRQKRRVANHDVIYKSFIKIVSELSEAELCEVQDLITEQLAQIDAGEEARDVV